MYALDDEDLDHNIEILNTVTEIASRNKDSIKTLKDLERAHYNSVNKLNTIYTDYTNTMR